MKTRLTELLGIEYPILQGGMQNLGTPELAAAVSNAGGCGTINRTIYADNLSFRQALRELKSLTDKPFIVNISLLPGTSVGDDTKETIQICGEEDVKAIETSGTNPKELVPLIHSEGILHIHKVPGAKYALSAEKAGCDAVSVVGFECGGHPGKDEVSSLILTNKASRICHIPIIAGGGYVDGRGLASALALGADGIVMGTRFVATQECAIHENFKKWIAASTENDTVLCQKSIHNMVRVANNACAKKCLDLEQEPGITLEKLMPIISGSRGRTAYKNGDTDYCLFPIGNAVGLINDIPTIKEVIANIMSEYKETVTRLYNLNEI